MATIPNPLQLKRCRVCDQERPTDHFYPCARGRHGVNATCRFCKSDQNQATRERRGEVHRQWRARHPDYEYFRKLKADLGLTREGYMDLLTACSSGCQICGVHLTQDRLCVDHCHETNAVRGILCAKHNAALGMLGDDLETVRALYHYLLAHQVGPSP